MARAQDMDFAGSWVNVSTGDGLFPGGVGNRQKDPQRVASLIEDVER